MTEKKNAGVCRIRLLIQFDGTEFYGWAEQPKHRTVKGTLKSCIRQVSGETVDLRGCSRTDSGAHADGFVADFATLNGMPAERWAIALNRQLPEDIRIRKSEEVDVEFHSRFFARSRKYEYRIAHTYKADPRVARYVYECGYELDLAKMQQAAKCLIGRHDFRAFGEELEGLKNAVREVKSASVKEVGGEIRFEIEATAFIRGMVRRIAGGLFEVGAGKRTVEELEALLSKERREGLKSPVVLPAKGLTLKRVKYGPRLRDLRKEKKVEEE